MPDLLQHDAQAPFILDYLREKLGESGDQKATDASDIAVERFIEFAKEHLSQNRPALQSAADGNFVITLQDGRQVMIAPPMESGMAKSYSQPVTGPGTYTEDFHHKSHSARH